MRRRGATSSAYEGVPDMPVHREVEEVFPCSEHDPQIKSEQPFDVSVHARDTNAINPYYVNNLYLHPGGGGPR